MNYVSWLYVGVIVVLGVLVTVVAFLGGGDTLEPEPATQDNIHNVDIGDWFRYRIFHTPQGDVACIFSGYENAGAIDCNW